MEPDAEQGWGRMIQLRAPWFVWLLLVLGIYMAITAPATLGAVAGFIDHLFVTVAGGLTHFLNSSVKGSLPGCIRRDRAVTSSTSVLLVKITCLLSWSGWPDLNRRPLRPEAKSRRGLPALRHA